MLPQIHSPKNTISKSDIFEIDQDGIEDLFFEASDSQESIKKEILQLQRIIDKNQDKIYQVYLEGGGSLGMNRNHFSNFVIKALGDEGISAADDIFSCATNLYIENDDTSFDLNKDTKMTGSQFITGLIRVANLYSLMNDGMVNTSRLSSQTQKLLDLF